MNKEGKKRFSTGGMCRGEVLLLKGLNSKAFFSLQNL